MTKHTESIEVVVKDQRRRRWSLAEKAAAGASNLRTRHERVIGRSAGRRFGWTAVSVAQARTPRCFDRRLRWRGSRAGIRTGGCTRGNRQAAARAGQEDLGERNPQGSRGVRRRKIADLPSYGYRRACALVNRQRTARGAPKVNAKRVYRVMAQAALLLPKAPRRRPSAARKATAWPESFVNTFKRDYVARLDLKTVLAQLPAAFEQFNEVHPHSSLKMRSPREFRRQQAAGAYQLLYCE